MRSSNVPGGWPVFTGSSVKRGPPSALYSPSGSPRCPPGTLRVEAPQSSALAGVGKPPGAVTGLGPRPAPAVDGDVLPGCAGVGAVPLVAGFGALLALDAGAVPDAAGCGAADVAVDVDAAAGAAGAGTSRMRTLASGARTVGCAIAGVAIFGNSRRATGAATSRCATSGMRASICGAVIGRCATSRWMG